MMLSVMVVIPKVKSFVHFPSLMLLSQKNAVGRQAARQATTTALPYEETMTSATKPAMRDLRATAKRRNWRSAETLVIVRAAL